jgi:Domain of unknown function (DUF4349)
MTAAELTAQIRAAKPTASDGLRERVRAIATAEPAPAFRARLRVPSLRLPRLRIVLPVTAATAIAAAAAIAFIHPQAQQQNVLSAAKPATTELSTDLSTRQGRVEGTPSTDTHAAATPSAPAFKSAAPGPTTGRATRYAAQLTISVKNGNALSDATTRAQATVRDLGGYVVSVSFASADAGNASLTLRVPTARVQEALTRLAALGRVVGQQVQIDDLQATLDQLDRRLTVLRARIAHVTALLTDTTLTSVRRAELEAQRTALQDALRGTHQSRAGTANDARYATIQLQLQTAAKAVAPLPSRANRILHQAGRILAWEGAAVLYALVIAGPFAVVGAALAFAARTRRRGQETRLLARS